MQYWGSKGEAGLKSLGPTCQDTTVRPTGQGDALLIPRLPLTVLVQGTAPTAGLLVTEIHRVILGTILIPGNGDLEHSGQRNLSHRSIKRTISEDKQDTQNKIELRKQTINTYICKMQLK